MEITTQDSSSNLEEKRIGTSLQTQPQDLTKYSQAITPLITTTLKVHPACLEFAPANISHKYPESLRTKSHEYFVVGTYQLAEELKGNEEKRDGLSDDKHQERIGGVSLFRFQNSGTESELYWIQDIFQNYGVYDIKFLHFHPIFAAATTTGRIVLFQLQETTSRLQIRELASHLIFPEEIIIISLSWFPLLNAQDKTRILALSVENGGLYLIRFTPDFTSFEILNDEQPLHEHIYKTPFFENKERVWCCAFSSSSSPVPNTVFSGGDDNYFRSSTLTLPFELKDIQTCKNTDSLVSASDGDEGGEGEEGMKEKFPAGVTSILPLPLLDSEIPNSHTLLIGSYDNHLRLCNLTTSEFTTLLTLNLEGGVYRLKFLDSHPPTTLQKNQEVNFRILACCMHAGTKILHVRRREGVWSVEVVAEVGDNESMCYAGDVQHLPEGREEDGEEGRICVSSSWADSKLSVWKFDPNLV